MGVPEIVSESQTDLFTESPFPGHSRSHGVLAHRVLNETWESREREARPCFVLVRHHAEICGPRVHKAFDE